MRLFDNDTRPVAILILFCIVLFTVGLGAMPLTDPDEVFYAETAKEMLQRNDFVTPYIFGKPQFEKPPLYYWSAMMSFAVFGTNEFSARFPSVLFGILGVVGVYLFGRVFIGRKTGFFAGVVLATSVNYLALSRACVTDMALGVFILYALFSFFRGYHAREQSTRWYLFSSVWMGLAVLTKGPIGAFLPVVIAGSYLIAVKDVRALTKMPLFAGGLLFLAVSLPWYLAAYKMHGAAFIDEFFGFHNVVRFLKPEHAWGDVFYYYAPVVAGGFFPWTVFLPLGIWQGIREKETRARNTYLFLLIWFLVIFLFFSVSRTKLPTYVFPVFPALALAMGRLIDVISEKRGTPKMEKTLNLLLWIFLAFLIAGLVVLYLVLKERYPALVRISLITGSVYIPLMAVVVALFLKRKYAAGLAGFLASFIVMVFPISYGIMPEVGRYESSKEVSEKVLTFMKPDEALGAETHFRRGVAFYTGRVDVPDVHRHHVITDFLKRKERVWAVIKEKNHIQLYTDERLPYDRPTYVVYRAGKKVIITNRMPEDEQYLKARTKDDPY